MSTINLFGWKDFPDPNSFTTAAKMESFGQHIVDEMLANTHTFTKPTFFATGGYVPDGSDIPNIPTPVSVFLSTGGIYADNGSGNLFHFSSHVRNSGTRPAVAVFGYGKGKRVWGGNFVGYADTASAIAQAVEPDYGNVGTGATTVSGDQALPTSTLNVASTTGAVSTGVVVCGSNIGTYTGITGTSFTGISWIVGTGTVLNGSTVSFSIGGTATGVAIVAEGSNIGASPPGPYLQFQANIASSAAHGLVFNNSGQPAVASTGFLIKAAAESAAQGVGFSGSIFTTAGLYVPLNSGSTTASIGLLLAAEGGFANAGSAIDIRSGAAGSSIQDGIVFRVSGGRQPVTGSLIKMVGSITATIGLDLTGGAFSGAGIAMGDNSVTMGTTTGTKWGTSINHKQAWWGATPVVRQALTYSRSGAGETAAVAAIRSLLATVGLITDSTTA